MKSHAANRLLALVLGLLASCCTVSSLAQPTPENAAPAGAEAIPAEVCDVLAAIERSDRPTFDSSDVLHVLHAVWWDAHYSTAEIALAGELHRAERPITVQGADGRTVTFTKRAAPEAAALARAMLPAPFNPNESTFFIAAFRRTKDAGVFIGACRLNKLAVNVMDKALIEMTNEARFAAKTAGPKPLLDLFAAFETGYKEANPELQAEFADAIRRLRSQFDVDPAALPDAVWHAAWLQ